eukprot:9683122-Lingulodinium_polyedra.AAC.1
MSQSKSYFPKTQSTGSRIRKGDRIITYADNGALRRHLQQFLGGVLLVPPDLPVRVKTLQDWQWSCIERVLKVLRQPARLLCRGLVADVLEELLPPRDTAELAKVAACPLLAPLGHRVELVEVCHIDVGHELTPHERLEPLHLRKLLGVPLRAHVA